ncbi:MAG TPA: hypothetical protein DCF45_12780 [Gammaproteobacteria bacterium]|nr:hypothetical protein [Gammaproteobacteria bacterium]
MDALLGLSLLPLHISLLSNDPIVQYILWGNHLIVVTIWLFGLAHYRTTLFRLGYLIGGVSLIALTWNETAGQVAWLLGLTSLLISRLATPPTEIFRYGVSCCYLLAAAAVMVGFEQRPELFAQMQPMVNYALHGLVTGSIVSTLLPAPAQQLRKAVTPLELIIFCWLLFTFAAVAALLLSFTTTPLTSTPTQAAAAAVLGAGLFLLSRYRPPGAHSANNGRMEEYQQWALVTLQEAQTMSRIEDYLQRRITTLNQLFNGNGASWDISSYCGSIGTTDTVDTPILQSTLANQRTTLSIAVPPNDNLQRQLDFALAFLSTLVQLRQHQTKVETQKHLESIYETGARITHDVKNLLQSLNTLTTAVVHSKPDQATAIQNLMQKQLPLLREKLQITLDKLAAPEDVSTTFQVARIWWEKLQLRYEGRDVKFTQKFEVNHLIPKDLFEQVAENLLENAQRKRQMETNIEVRAYLEITADRIALMVTDTGSPVADEISSTLFKAPVDSTGGYGIALYQCAAEASKQGFTLQLTENDPGNVSFLLYGEIK